MAHLNTEYSGGYHIDMHYLLNIHLELAAKRLLLHQHKKKTARKLSSLSESFKVLTQYFIHIVYRNKSFLILLTNIVFQT